jgi:F0F1-type ATP synthase membrane subunit c/vacuolar-type H+-ATPase subunit K
MPKLSSKILIISIFLCTLLFVILTDIHAQEAAPGMAITAELEEAAEPGDLICAREGGLRKCADIFEPSIFGVVTDNPATSIEVDNLNNPALLISNGIANVKVSTSNGNIEKGNFVTSSTTPGVGMLADQSGYVVGMALESYDDPDPGKVGQILVAVHIHAAAGLSGARSNLIQVIRRGVGAPLFDPLESLRYILAALILLASFVLGFVYFGRAAGMGIEAVGRNPLASRKIQLTVLIHVVVTVVIVLAGFALAYLVLIL